MEDKQDGRAVVALLLGDQVEEAAYLGKAVALLEDKVAVVAFHMD